MEREVVRTYWVLKKGNQYVNGYLAGLAGKGIYSTDRSNARQYDRDDAFRDREDLERVVKVTVYRKRA